MKRCYLGAGVLLALLILGAVTSRWMENHYSRLEKQMLEAAFREPEDLLDLALKAQGDWNRGLTAVLADHQYLERAELAFGQLVPAARRRDRGECTRLCLEIAHIFQLLAQDQQLKWENLL